MAADASILHTTTLHTTTLHISTLPCAAHATTDLICFTLPLTGLSRLVGQHGQLLSYIRTYALVQLARLAQRIPQLGGDGHGSLHLDAFGQAEDEGVLTGARSRDFEPLRKRELESLQFSWASTLTWLRRSLKPLVQPGMRHAANPLSGSLAQQAVRSMTTLGLADLLTDRETAPLVNVTPSM